MSEHPIPSHIAFIMDGNGRWAAGRGLPRLMGHRKGAEALQSVIRAGRDFGVRIMTFYCFSTENWDRSQTEVDALMSLLRRYLENDLDELHEASVRLKVIGDRKRLPDDIVTLIDRAERETADNRAMMACMAISYGSRQEITHAAQRLAEKVAKGILNPADLTPNHLTRELDTAGIPDPDLLVRTSGEMRISNFLLWQMAYSEIIFLDKYWPDFTAQDLRSVIAEYQKRDRRYGVLPNSA